MKEQIHTIPIHEALEQGGECPLCYIEKKTKERVMDFVLGSSASYMEADIRSMTDQEGFCRAHFKEMFQYGNSLGNAWILKTHYKKTIEEYEKITKHWKPEGKKKEGLFRKGKTAENSFVNWLGEREKSCFICKQLESSYQRYMDTFFELYQKDKEFQKKIMESKGFCLSHFRDLCMAAEEKLKEEEQKNFYAEMLPWEKEQLERIFEDVSWLIEKFDYRNKDADWKDSKDAIQRGMQKLKGGFPAEKPYEMKKQYQKSAFRCYKRRKKKIKKWH